MGAARARDREEQSASRPSEHTRRTARLYAELSECKAQQASSTTLVGMLKNDGDTRPRGLDRVG